MYIRHCTNNPHTHPSRLQSTRTTGLPFTLKRSSILSPHLCPSIPVCPGTPAVLVACCAYFPASWLCIQMAVGMNDGRYRFALLPGMLNVLILLVCLLSNSGLSGWVSPAQNCAYFVCDYSQWWAVPMLFWPLPHHPACLLNILIKSVFALVENNCTKHICM